MLKDEPELAAYKASILLMKFCSGPRWPMWLSSAADGTGKVFLLGDRPFPPQCTQQNFNNGAHTTWVTPYIKAQLFIYKSDKIWTL